MAGRSYGRRYAKKDEEFDEGDVWGMMEDNNKEMKMINSSPKVRKPIKDSTFFTPPSSTSSPRNFTAPRMIPKSSSSDVFTVGNSNKQQSSAPMDIPDWSKIYGKTSKKKNGSTSTTNNSSPWVNNSNNNNNSINGHHDNDGFYYGMGDHHYGSNGYGDHHHHDDDGDEDDDDDGMVPPHEYLARKLARNEISSFSVYEGIGRTLKGRDLCKVRNTILSKTGFLESS